MYQHELKPSHTRKKPGKRVGRGNGSGRGTFSGHGCKGQNARSGGGVRPGFEGGQTPLSRRLPKLKGFKNYFKKTYQIINVGDIKKCKGEEITAAELFEANLIKKIDNPVKILGNGDIDIKVTVKVDKVSQSAIKKIEAVGGRVEILNNDKSK